MGKPHNRKDITDEQFEQLKKLASIFCTKEDAGHILGLDSETVVRNIKDRTGMNWAEFFNVYAASGRTMLRRKQFELAQNSDKTMLIWLGKQYLGQSDKMEQRVQDVTNEMSQSLMNEFKELIKK